MNLDHIVLICLAIAIVAFLYSSVGHAGASGYIAVMTLFGLASVVIKPAALVLNILVASIASWQFWRAGHFSWRLFWPFAVGSTPLAFLGGRENLPPQVFKMLVGFVLLYSAARFFFEPKAGADEEIKPPGKAVAVSTGAGLGLLAGLTGTGGGIYLTPLMILMRWARTKTASAVSALFILVNSISGLLGNISSTRQLPLFALPLAGAAIVGGIAGSYLGSQRFSPVFIKKLLAVVLAIAGFKFIFA
ncbi:MAG: sulfite exporter TauE/SafE family protein [Blastocatellia bacterium]